MGFIQKKMIRRIVHEKNLILYKNSKILTSKSIPMQNRFSWICSLYKIFNIYVLFFEEVT